MNRHSFPGVTRALTGASLLCLSLTASAFTFEDTGDDAGNPEQPLWQVSITEADIGSSFDIGWLLAAGSTNSDGNTISTDLKASSSFLVKEFSTSHMVLDVSIFNDTVPPVGAAADYNAAILSFGFGVTPDATGVLLEEGDTFVSIGEGSGGQQTFPGGFKQIDVCVFSDGCSGGSLGSGLQMGESDSLRLKITGDFTNADSASTTLAMLSDFPLKFQGTEGSFQLAGVPGDGDEPPDDPKIPVPGTLLLMAVGLVGLRRYGPRRSFP